MRSPNLDFRKSRKLELTLAPQGRHVCETAFRPSELSNRYSVCLENGTGVQGFLHPRGIARFTIDVQEGLCIEGENEGKCLFILREGHNVEIQAISVRSEGLSLAGDQSSRQKRLRIDTSFVGTEFGVGDLGLLMIEESHPSPPDEIYQWEIDDPEIGTLKSLDIPGEPCVHFVAKGIGKSLVRVRSTLDGAGDEIELTVVKKELTSPLWIDYDLFKNIVPQSGEENPSVLRVLTETLSGLQEIPCRWESENPSILAVHSTEKGRGEVFPGALTGKCRIKAIPDSGEILELELIHPEVLFKGPFWVGPNLNFSINAETRHFDETGYFPKHSGNYPSHEDQFLKFEEPNVYPIRIGSKATGYFSEKIPVICSPEPIVVAHRRTTSSSVPDLYAPIDHFLKNGYLHLFVHVIPELVRASHRWGLRIHSGFNSYWVGHNKELVEDQGEPVPFYQGKGGSPADDPFQHVFSGEFWESSALRDTFDFFLFDDDFRIAYQHSGSLPNLQSLPKRD